MKRTAKLLLALLSLCSLLMTAEAYAVTPAGTVITNTATLDYKDLGGTSFTQMTATATVTVDKVGGLELATVGQTKTIPDSSWATYFVHVTNTGNDNAETIALTFSNDHGTTDGWKFDVYVDNENGSSATGTYGSEDVLIASSPKTYLNVPMGTSEYLVVRVYAPAGVNNVTDIVSLSAATTHTVAGATVNDQASASGTLTTTVKKPFTFSKTVDNATPDPGATVTFTLSYKNELANDQDSVRILDYLPENFGTPSSISNSGSWNAGTRTITWNLSNITAGASASVTFNATVSSSLSKDDIVTNNALLLYPNPDGYVRHFASSRSVTVAGVRSWTIAISPAEDSINVGTSDLEVTAQKHYLITLTNTGNGPDAAKINLSSSTQSLAWKLFADAGVSGTYESGTDKVEYTYGSSTGEIARDGSVSYWAIVTVPQNKVDGSVDVATYAAKSSDDAITASGSTTTTTHIKAPVMTFEKSVTKLDGDAKPGSHLRYTIHYKNTGTGAANNIIITDASPANTTYMADSLATSWDGSTFAKQADPDPLGSTIQWNIGNVSGKNAAGTADATKKEGWLRFTVIIN